MDSQSSIVRVNRGLKDGESRAASCIHERFVRRLLALASSRLDPALSSKLDPADVVQSAFRTFFRRAAEGQFEFGDWESLWALLARITVRKVGHSRARLCSEKRNIRRESSDEHQMSEIIERGPGPEEIAMLEETLQSLLDGLTPEQQEMIFLKLQHCTNDEISQRTGRTERTIRRVLERVRERLEGLLQETLHHAGGSP